MRQIFVPACFPDWLVKVYAMVLVWLGILRDEDEDLERTCDDD